MKKIMVVSAERFIEILKEAGEDWKFFEGVVPYEVTTEKGTTYTHVKVGLISKILIMPTCHDKCTDGNSPAAEEIAAQIKSVSEQSEAILMIGTCCPVSGDKIERVREILAPQKILTADFVASSEEALQKNAVKLAEYLRYNGKLMKKLMYA